MKRFLIFMLLGVMVFFSGYDVRAAGPLESVMTAYLVKQDKDGKEILEKTENAVPGEVVEYQLVYRNTGDQPLKELEIDGPIPENTRYIAKSANTEVSNEFQVSIDKGATWEKEPVVRLVKQPDGTNKEVVIPPEEYTNLRWKAKDPILPGKTQVYRYRVLIR